MLLRIGTSIVGILFIMFITIIVVDIQSAKEIDAVTIPHQVIMHDNCQYVIYSASKGHGYMAHKGNCSNKWHEENGR